MNSNGGVADPLSSSSSLTTEAEEADENNHQVFRNTVIAFKPRLLYSTIFVWSTLTCGKFTAPLLQQLSPKFSESMIGLTFALQYMIVAVLASWGGSLADAYERKTSSWGLGRLQVLSVALTLGTIAFLGHGIPGYFHDIFPGNETMRLIWHISMRAIYAVSLGVVAPTLDGLALAHLDCIEGSSSIDFGKERMYGAVWWGAGSLGAGVGIDYFGFDFLYAFLFMSTLASYISMIVYLWALRKDTTGSFKCNIENDDMRRIHDNSTSENHNYHEATTIEKEHKILSNTELLCIVCRTGYGQALLFFTFALAMGISVVDNLAFLFFDTLGASNTMDGVTVVFTVLFEIPVFYVAPILLEKYGPGRLLLAAGIAYVVRVLGYTMIPEGHMYIILILETLHGLSYAGSKSGSVEFIASMIPQGYEAQGQGVLILVTYLGIFAGLIIAGWIQEHLGPRVMFRVMAAVVSVGILVLLFAELFHKEENQKTTSTVPDRILDKEETDEQCHLIKSESCASSASAFADYSTERYIRKMKYDSLNKYVKDW